MAAPVVQSRATGRQTTNTTTHTITMPSGITAGDLLVVVLTVDGGSGTVISQPAGWSRPAQMHGGTRSAAVQVNQSTSVAAAVFYRTATGGDTCTVTTSTNEQSSHVAFRISGAAGINVASTASATSANPPALPAGSSQEFLWIAARCADGSATADSVATGAPSSYGNLTTIAAANTQGTGTSTAERTLTATSTDPGAFTATSEPNVTFTIAVWPSLPYTDRTYVSHTGNGLTSTYHAWADGIAPASGDTAPGLLIWLHGDGAYEHANFDDPGFEYVFEGATGVRAVGKQRGYIVVSALAPDTTGTVTWWEGGQANTVYLQTLIEGLTAGYGADPEKLVLAGYSGGAQHITWQYLDFQWNVARGRGSCVFSGGEAPDNARSYSAALKATWRMKWVVGELDDAAHSEEGFDARAAAEYAENDYRTNGFFTSIELVPGHGHNIDGLFGGYLAAWMDANGIGRQVSSRASSWDVRARDTAARVASWGLRARDGTSRAAVWDVRSRVASTRSASWAVRSRDSTSFASSWAVSARAVSSATASWAVKSRTAASRSASWLVAERSSGSASATWSVRSRTVASRSASWQVAQRAAGSSSATWGVRTRHDTDAVTAAWAVLTRATTARSASWDVSARPVSTHTGLWDTRARVTTSAATSWGVGGRPATHCTVSWAVRTRESATRAAGWATAARTTTTTTATWSVRTRDATTASASWAVGGRPSSSTTTTWAVRQRTSTSSAATWAVTTRTSASSPAAWAVRSRAATSTSCAWSVAELPARATSSTTAAWAVNRRGTASTGCSWSVRSRASFGSACTWSVRQRRTTDLGATWAVAVRAASTCTTTWDLADRGMTSRSASWNARTRHTTTASGSWSVSTAATSPWRDTTVHGIHERPRQLTIHAHQRAVTLLERP